MAKCKKKKSHVKQINKKDKRGNNIAIALSGTLVQRTQKNKSNSKFVL